MRFLRILYVTTSIYIKGVLTLGTVELRGCKEWVVGSLVLESDAFAQ